MSDNAPYEELKSPLFEFCEKKLQEFEDLEDDMKSEVTEHVRELYAKIPAASNKSHFFKSPTLSSDSSSIINTYNTADLESEDETHVNWAYNAVLEIMFSPGTVESEHPRLFSNRIDSFMQEQEKSIPLAEKVKRRRLFVMLTSAKEFLTKKWREMFNKSSDDASEPGNGDTSVSISSKDSEANPKSTGANDEFEVDDCGASASECEVDDYDATTSGFCADDEGPIISESNSSASNTSSKDSETASKSTSGNDGFEADDEVSNASSYV